FWLAFLHKDKQYPQPFWWVHLTFSIIIYLFIGGRSDVVGFVIAILVVFHLIYKPISNLWLLLIGSFAVVYGYVMKSWRHVMGGMTSGDFFYGKTEFIHNFKISDFYSFFGSTDLSDIRFFIVIHKHYDSLVDYKYGETFLRIFYQIVPRSIWPDKPLDLSLEAAHLYLPGARAGTPPGFLPELYMNFGIIGVIIGSITLGIVLSKVYYNAVKSHPSPYRIVMYAIVVPKILLLPSATLANLIWNAIPLLFAIYIAYNFSKSSREIVIPKKQILK
ncbi:MAG: O-antigen polysaccharide polymerase Wzy, partial [Bacteroidales bacterium]|nr:O-antigen polysaccharide polymerase Wzy [Bacteroidales bacterium]